MRMHDMRVLCDHGGEAVADQIRRRCDDFVQFMRKKKEYAVWCTRYQSPHARRNLATT